jgi:hypothetical protein
MGRVEFTDYRYEYHQAVGKEEHETPVDWRDIFSMRQLHDDLFYNILHSELNLHDNALKTLLGKGTFVLRVFREQTHRYPIVAVYRPVPPLTKPITGKRAPWGNLNMQAQEFFYAYKKGIIYHLTSKPQILFDWFEEPVMVLHMPELAQQISRPTEPSIITFA